MIAWGEATYDGHDIVITHVDIDNLLRAKAAIYAGFNVLAESVGVPLELVEQVLDRRRRSANISTSKKRSQIGLLPDMPWDHFHFLGNTAVRGAYLALLDRQARARITDIAVADDLYRTVRRQHVSMKRLHRRCFCPIRT